MKNILTQFRVLKLNKQWKRIGTCSVRSAIKSMTKTPKSGKEEDLQFRALHIDFPVLDSGEIDFNSVCSILPVKWADWIQLPVRSHDQFIRTVKLNIRVPTVIITESYNKIPKKKPQYSSYEVAKRDGFIDQYTGRFIPKGEGNIDHHMPRDLGGITCFENCVYTSKQINRLKANMHPDDFYKKHGYRLIRKPVTPSPRILIHNRYDIPEWNLFPD